MMPLTDFRLALWAANAYTNKNIVRRVNTKLMAEI